MPVFAQAFHNVVTAISIGVILIMSLWLSRVLAFCFDRQPPIVRQISIALLSMLFFVGLRPLALFDLGEMIAIIGWIFASFMIGRAVQQRKDAKDYEEMRAIAVRMTKLAEASIAPPSLRLVHRPKEYPQ